MRSNLNLDFYLIRHGQTERNTQDLIGQSAEEPLNETGKQQVQKLAERFKKENLVFDVVYYSSYVRAVETFQIACAAFINTVPSYCVADLREIYQGDACGYSRANLYTPETKEKMDYSGMGFRWENGEAMYDVEHRVSQWLEKEILNNPFTRVDKPLKIAVFSHGIALKCLLHYIMQFDHRMTWRLSIANTSITRVKVKNGQWFIHSINDYSHLA
jgi:alpha-ribazole phosphatase